MRMVNLEKDRTHFGHVDEAVDARFVRVRIQRQLETETFFRWGEYERTN